MADVSVTLSEQYCATAYQHLSVPLGKSCGLTAGNVEVVRAGAFLVAICGHNHPQKTVAKSVNGRDEGDSTTMPSSGGRGDGCSSDADILLKLAKS